MSSKYICPECNETQDHFQVRGYYEESGSCSGILSPEYREDRFVEWQDYNSSDSSEEEENYSCPYCDHEFNWEETTIVALSNMEVFKFEDEEEIEAIDEPTKQSPQIIEEKGDIVIHNNNRNIEKTTKNQEYILCPTCKTMINQKVTSPGLPKQETTICLNCETEIN